MEEVVEPGIQLRAHQEQTSVQSGKQQGLGHPRSVILLKEAKGALVVKPEKDHAEHVFKNADRREHVEEAVLRFVAREPKVVRKAKNKGPDNTRNEYSPEEHP